jgi:hypothetical protein
MRSLSVSNTNFTLHDTFQEHINHIDKGLGVVMLRD